VEIRDSPLKHNFPAAPQPARLPQKGTYAITPRYPWKEKGIYATREESLRSRLSELAIDPLKDIVSQYALDHAGSVMRLKTKSKVVDLFLTIVRSRSQHGDAFRN
jgi:hypothetical protein